MIPYEHIRDTQDRSWTPVLLARLAEAALPADEREQVAEALARLADPRAEPALLALLEDPGRDPQVREAAACALVEAYFQPEAERLRRWWASGDPWLRARALHEAGAAEEDLLLPVAEDPGHPLHVHAIAALTFGFDEPRHQRLKVQALSHPDAAVRAAAADALVWDEPLIALEPLLRAAADPHPQVAIAALRTLLYYPSRRCLLALHALTSRVEGPVLEQLRETLEQLGLDFRDALARASAQPRLGAWMAPVAHLLPPVEPDPAPGPAPSPACVAPPAVAETADALIALFGALDGPWAGRAARFPRALPSAELDLATPFLLSHPDAGVRERSCALFSSGQAHAALLALMQDPVFLVRKSAVYHLGLCAPAPDVAPTLWSHLHAPGTQSTHAQETLGAWVTHAPRALALERLPRLAREDPREGVRARAVAALLALGAREQLQDLVPLLAEPPRVTWAVHLGLLEAIEQLGLVGPRELLEEVDNLYVQAALNGA